MIQHVLTLFMDEYRTDDQNNRHGKLQTDQADAESLALLRGAKCAFQGKSGIE